jgi:hypothetical protein
MGIESGLAQQASMFSESLNIKPAPAVERTPDEAGQDIKVPEQGDKVSISEEARALVAAEKPGDSAQTEGEDAGNPVITALNDRIEKIEAEIKELEKSNLPQKEKQQQVQGKQAELMELRDQLVKAQEEQLKIDGMAARGGTRANGFGKSVAEF